MKYALYLHCIFVMSAAFAAPPDQQSNPTSREKITRTATQRKIDSQLLYALYRERGEAEVKGVPPGELRVTFDAKRRALVTIRARVTKDLLAAIQKFGGDVVSSSERDNDVRAYLPLARLDELAAWKTVFAIVPGEEAMTHRPK